MAKYTRMEKQSEDSYTVSYRFGPGDGRWGVVQFDKKSWNYQELEKIPGETFENHLEQAVFKLIGVARVGPDFPDLLVYAA